MHPYFPYLISDIKAAERPNGWVAESSSQTFQEEMEEIERWVAGENEPEHTFGYYCGLDALCFPPAGQLTAKELKLVCKAFEQLLFSWNAGIDLPKRLPLPLRYNFMVRTLDEGFALMNSGCMLFDYCTGNAPECVFKEYCPCLTIRNELQE